MRRISHAFRSLAAAVFCASVVVGPAGAYEQPGLRADAETWHGSRIVTRLGVGLSSAATSSPLEGSSTMDPGRQHGPSQLTSLNLLGDVYFTRSNRFRATGGVLLGTRALPLSSAMLGTAAVGGSLVVARNVSLMPDDPANEMNDASGTVPYLGIGFSDASAQGRWGFSADVGVLALTPRPAVRLGRVFSGQQTFDDLLRELRLTPTIQVGVSYSF